MHYLYLKGENLGKKVQRDYGDFHGVLFTIGHGHSGGDHVRITDCLNLRMIDTTYFYIGMVPCLVDVIVVEPLIKKAVEVAEEVNVLVCSVVRCDVREVNNVAEKDGR